MPQIFFKKVMIVQERANFENASYVINKRYSRGKMSPVCHNFVQNAWKKDFCSNCFKSREEHVRNERTTESSSYLPPTFQSKNTLFKKTPPSILKISPKKKNKRNVRFPEEVCSVIGYGGDDWSDGEEFETSEDNEDDDVFPETEEERELHKLTKSNTDFNTVKANLLTDLATKSYTSLLLGKTQTDSAGKKKTLMVSVTPFGQDNKGSPIIKSHIRKPAVIHVSDVPAEETPGYKTNIILSSYIKETECITSSETISNTESVYTEKSLLEEISETLQQNKITSCADLNLTSEYNKPTIIKEKVKESMQDDFDKKDTVETKKNSLTRKSPLARTQERPKLHLSRPEFKFCKINIDNSSVDSAVSTGNSTANNSVASDDDSFNGRTDSDNDDSGHFSETNKCEETVKIKVFNETDKNIKMSPIGKTRKSDGLLKSGYSTFQGPLVEHLSSKQPENMFSAEASRELAGEPDGRADPDESSEAPALPNSPVPVIDPRPSFLHGMISDIMPLSKPALPEKPKVPIKPVMKQTTKKSITTHQQVMHLHQALIKKEEVKVIRTLTEEKNNEINEVHEDKDETVYYAQPVLTKQDSDTSLNSLSKSKQPSSPASPFIEENINTLYQRNTSNFTKSDSPVVREMEKRERASLSTVPKEKTVEESNDDKKGDAPKPAPRKHISLSQDNLHIDEKRKGKYKFSLKKLLGLGSSKDLDRKELSVASVSNLSCKSEEIYEITPKPKPRPVIIHPIDINGTSVEVLKTNCEKSDGVRRGSYEDAASIYTLNSTDNETSCKVVNKPAPPPRNSSEDKNNSTVPKPVRPPPPKSASLQKKQKQQAWTPTPNKTDNIYANLGEIRSALAPRKPERTASMREREAHLELPKRRTPIDDDKDEVDDGSTELVQATNDAVIHNYDDVYNTVKYDEENCDSAKNSDSDYEYVHHQRSSSPECDASIKQREAVDSNVESRKSDEFPKYGNGIFNRSSLPYCGSETESEIYSPYSFYSTSDNLDGSANDDYQNEMTPKTTTNKLRVRKGRSVVHKKLEDNYGAVIIANHEALAQVLEQVHQHSTSATLHSSLRSIKSSTNLRWSDFSIQPSKHSFVKAGKRIFYQAVWNSNQGPVNVTLMLNKEHMASQLVCQQSVQPQTLSLNAITEFCDLVPLQQFGEEGENLVQATIVVLAHAQVDTIQSYGDSLHSAEGLTAKENQLVQTEQMHEAIFMMLQLINGLKYLQAREVEYISETLTSFIVLKEIQPMASHGSTMNLAASDDRLNSLSAPKTNSYGRLCILQGLSEEINCTKSAEEEHLNSLCQCAIKALETLLPGEKLTPVLKEVLQGERAVSLNQAKSVLEFMLWGPLDVVQGVPIEERELSLQRWLDLERATVLHGLVRSRVQLNVFEQLHLMFLVRSTSKTMCEASALLEKANVY